MPVFSQPQNQSVINAFQAPTQQSAFVPSVATSQMLAGDSGTPWDTLANLGFGIQRQDAEQEVANQEAARQAAATALEADRFQLSREDKQAALELAAGQRQEELDWREEQVGNVQHAAQVKREHDEAMKRIDEENKQKVAAAKRANEQQKIAVLVSQFPEAFAGVDTSGMKFTEAKTFMPGKDGKVAPRMGLSTRTGIVAAIKEGTFGGGDPLMEMDEEQQNNLANAMSTRANELQVKYKTSQEKAELFAFQEIVEGKNPTGTLDLGEEDSTLWFDKGATFTQTAEPTLVTTQKGYDALKSGERFVDGKGTIGTKP